MNQSKRSNRVTVVGAGLAGSEAAWQLVQRGLEVDLYEMRPLEQTPAHMTDRCGELVCSNSLGSTVGSTPAALLKDEMRAFNSVILRVAEQSQVPGGSALTVDRDEFSRQLTATLEQHSKIHLRRAVVSEIPQGPTIIATGPLTHRDLGHSLVAFFGESFLSFFDAAAPIVLAETVDRTQAFWGSREGSQDYLNCPLTKDQYLTFYHALMEAEQHPRHDFETNTAFFEGCLPIEELARRGQKTPLFGPMKPIGLSNPLEGGRRPYAVVQLRQDNAAGSLLSLVGFQTNLRWGEQKRVFSLIPALRNAEFVRYGVMHRNTYLRSPKFLEPGLSAKTRPSLWFAGQMTGVEGYVESAATGIMAAINASRWCQGKSEMVWPRDTMMGALAHYITHTDPEHFQPMNANYGVLPIAPEIAQIQEKKERRRLLRSQAMTSLTSFIRELEADDRGYAHAIIQ